MTQAPAPGRLSIRFRLGLAVALALTPILVLGVVQAVAEYGRDSSARSASLSQAAQRSAAGARARVQAAGALLDTLASQSADPDCAAGLANLLDRVSGYENLVRFDASGHVVCAAAPVGASAAAPSDWFARLKSGPSPVVASAPVGAYATMPAILTAIATRDAAGHFAGALAAVIRLSSLSPDLSDPTLPRGADVALADAQGHLRVATPPSAFAPPPVGWADQATHDGAAVYDGAAADGERRTHAAAPLAGADAYVILSAPAPNILFWAGLNPLSNVIFPLLAWLVAWLTVWIVTERVVIRWLAYLDRIASIYAKGRFSVRPVQAESAPAEIRALAQTLDVMADAILARDQSLRESLAEKDALMREIHHRVKNNLQVITSLLNMQQRALTDPAARAAMSDTRQRITALALIYRALYQSPDLRRVDVRQFLEELIAQLTAGEGGKPSRVRTELSADDLEIDPDKLAPIALFAVEAITNARKHAFGEDGGLIRVKFAVVDGEVSLEIADDGRGEGDAAGEPGVGRTLMSAFARQLRGRAEIGAGTDGGVTARLVFPAPEAAKPNPEPSSELGGNLPAA